MQRFTPLVFVDDLASLEVSAELGHHLGSVRRLRVGDQLFVGDGLGSVRAVEISAVRPRVRLTPVAEIQTLVRPEPPVGIAMFLPSNERLAWAVQKLTEVGVDRIDLLIDAGDRRGGAKLSDAGMARLNRIAREAAQQSEQPWLPMVYPPVDAKTFFARANHGVAVLDPAGGRLMSNTTTLVIGPESGKFFSPPEAPRVSLGLPILRIETAAVAGAVVLASLRASLVCICDKF